MAVFKPTNDSTREGMYHQTKSMMFDFAMLGKGASPMELEENVHDLMHAMTQKTAGQQPYCKKDDIDFRDLDAIELRILGEAIALVNHPLWERVKEIFSKEGITE